MARLGDTRKGERSLIGRTLHTTVYGLRGQQAITLEVASLAPLCYQGRCSRFRGHVSADIEAAWAAGSDGWFYWVAFNHRRNIVLSAVQTGQRTYESREVAS